jgi:predicted GH43/DUF377 family glycosyl hydrolase
MRIVSPDRLLLLSLCFSPAVVAAEDLSDGAAAPPEVLPWLGLQEWERDTEGPVQSLGQEGSFDDTHIFAPCVVRDGDRFLMYYCGATCTVEERVFQLGLAVSSDGIHFERSPENPIYSFGDQRTSILTPTVLRMADARSVREHGKLRMWFSATDFAGSPNTLHESTSTDGLHWDGPSPSQLKHVYAPTVMREDAPDGSRYRLWYIDGSGGPWIVRHASSRDGRSWSVTEAPSVILDQEWEKNNLFYPTVVKADGVYLMWYGSYWAGHPSMTATGFAASLDGITWYKSPHNPVHRPDASRPWESHYVTSQSLMRLDDGSFRIWYASRKEPPHVNKYFAINTARWSGPGRPGLAND